MLEQFLEQLHQEVFDEAHDDENGGLRLTSFVKVILKRLEDADILTDGQVAFCKHDTSTPHGEVHGYAYDAEEDVLALFYFVDANDDTPLMTHLEVANVGKDVVDRGFRRLEGFVKLAKAQKIAGLDESQPAHELVQLVRESTKGRRAIALNVITTGQVSDKAAMSAAKDGFSRDVWDLLRLARTCGGTGDDKLSIDFENEYQHTLPCLVNEKASDGIQVLFTCIPGAVLAQIYNTYRARLLERNVRSFLQFTGKVNKGIRDTVLNNPARFLPYNNGISATASAVTIHDLGGGMARILRVDDFQIVNGGQTTASIASCNRRDAADLSQVAVAMKLTVVPEQEVDQLVPLISKYANTQNRIQEADFSANHPWHIELERLSRATWTSLRTPESPRGTRWFYERARGQYPDALAAEGTAAGRKKFRTENPSSQKFSKTDLAKFLLSWDQLPHSVSRGAQKCFVDFMGQITRDDRKPPDETELRRIVALAILFHTSEGLYGQLNYQGYRAQVVTYAVARLSHALQRRLPWKEIWEKQCLPQTFVQPLKTVLTAARKVIVNPPGGRNVTEWCKREECWSQVLALQLSMKLPEVDDGDEAAEPEGVVPLTPQERAIVDIVKFIHPEIWLALSKWAKSTQSLTVIQRKIAEALGKQATTTGKFNRRLAKEGGLLLAKATRLGWIHAKLSREIVNKLDQVVGR